VALVLGASGVSGARHPARSNSASAPRIVLGEINTLRHQVHLPAAHPTTSDDKLVIAAALALRDPVLPRLGGEVLKEYGVWGLVASSPALPSPIEVVQTWVFEDGWQGAATVNLDCTSPTARGCNSHREAILSPPPERGARLFVDVAVEHSVLQGEHAVSVAAILIWMAPLR
jgi:hypothetical protein